MKKIISFLVIIMSIMIVTGCSKEKERVLECNLSDVEEGYQINSTYKIYAKGDSVNKVETVEEIISEDSDYLNRLKNTVEEKYETQNNLYGGYTYDVKVDSTKLTTTLTIDYDKVNMDKLISDKPDTKKIVNKKNRITVESAISAYKTKGAICK